MPIITRKPVVWRIDSRQARKCMCTAMCTSYQTTPRASSCNRCWCWLWLPLLLPNLVLLIPTSFQKILLCTSFLLASSATCHFLTRIQMCGLAAWASLTCRGKLVKPWRRGILHPHPRISGNHRLILQHELTNTGCFVCSSGKCDPLVTNQWLALICRNMHGSHHFKCTDFHGVSFFFGKRETYFYLICWLSARRVTHLALAQTGLLT